MVERNELMSLPEGDTLIQVNYSSLNFKDARALSGNGAVTRQYPHTPGIDAAGTVVNSADADLKPGDEVLVIGYDLGMNTSGGLGQMIRVPSEWVVKLPSGLSQKESMIIGTAGFTAALCVEKLLLNGVEPSQGRVLVTGASGGVGMVAVALLSKLGFDVAASTGKQEAHARLTELGASEVVERNALGEEKTRPMLKEDWGRRCRCGRWRYAQQRNQIAALWWKCSRLRLGAVSKFFYYGSSFYLAGRESFRRGFGTTSN